MRTLHALIARLRRLASDPRRAARAALLAAVAWLVLRPPFFPVLTNAWTLWELQQERAAGRARVQKAETANARLRRQLGSDPFLKERLARQAGLKRAGEFDYLSVAEALPPCPTKARPSE